MSPRKTHSNKHYSKTLYSIIKRISGRQIKKRICDSVKEYLNQTTLHGFRYISNSKSTKLQSIFWAIICLISTCLCGILILSQLRSYQNNRITTTIATTAFPISQVPFPAVTICNFNVVHKENMEAIAQLLESDFSNLEIMNFFTNLSHLILGNGNVGQGVVWKQFKNIIKKLEKIGHNTDVLMAKLAHPCEKMLLSCFWKTREISCTQIFTQTKTTSGYCCSFNYHGVDLFNDEPYKPILGSGVGRQFSLELHIEPELSQYVSPIKQSKGVDIVLHSSTSFPDVSLYSTAVYPGLDIALSVKPEIIDSNDQIRSIDVNTRGCIFDEEIKMAWSKSYSHSTCVSECKVKSLIKLCKCIPFFYPIKKKIRYCTLLDIPCLKNGVKSKKHISIMDMLLLNSTSIFDDAKGENNFGADGSHCKCLPPCNEISYTYQIDQEPIDSESSQTNYSILSVYFGQVTCLKIARNVYMTWEIVLASIGGLIGLCLGGSILSIIELVYFVINAIIPQYNPSSSSKVDHYEPKLYVSDFKIKNKNKLESRKPRVTAESWGKIYKSYQ